MKPEKHLHGPLVASRSELVRRANDLKKQVTELNAALAGQRQRTEREAERADMAEHTLRTAVVERERWQRRAEAAEAALASMGCRP